MKGLIIAINSGICVRCAISHRRAVQFPSVVQSMLAPDCLARGL